MGGVHIAPVGEAAAEPSAQSDELLAKSLSVSTTGAGKSSVAVAQVLGRKSSPRKPTSKSDGLTGAKTAEVAEVRCGATWVHIIL